MNALKPILLISSGITIAKIISNKNSFSIASDNKEIINNLALKSQPYFIKFLKMTKKKGYDFRISEGLRSAAVQTAYYAQGRESLLIVNSLRKSAGLSFITAEQNKKTITNAQAFESYHQYGLAIDIVDRNKGYTDFENSTKLTEIRKIATDCGLEYISGDWDKVHFQKSFGYSTSELKEALINKTIADLLS